MKASEYLFLFTVLLAFLVLFAAFFRPTQPFEKIAPLITPIVKNGEFTPVADNITFCGSLTDDALSHYYHAAVEKNLISQTALDEILKHKTVGTLCLIREEEDTFLSLAPTYIFAKGNQTDMDGWSLRFHIEIPSRAEEEGGVRSILFSDGSLEATPGFSYSRVKDAMADYWPHALKQQ